MSVPEPSTTLSADAVSLLTSAYKGKSVIEALIRSLGNRAQEVEDAAWAIINATQIPETLETRPPREDLGAVALGDEYSIPGEIGFFLRAVGVSGITAAAAPPALTPGNAAYAPSWPGAQVVDGGVTWTWFPSGNPFGFILDALGEIAGEPRLARGDEEYLQAVRVKLRANRSLGRVQDILDVMGLLSTSIGSWTLTEPGASMPRSLWVDAYGVAYPATIKRILGLARAAGVRLEFGYSSAILAGTFTFEDVVAGGVGGTFEDSVSGGVGDVLPSREIA